MRSIELFTGAGGLALGTALSGFEHAQVVEWDHDSCETLRLNKERGFEHVRDWSIIEGDVRELDYGAVGAVELIAGGVPCQPFSLGGKHRAHEDERDMFPEFARAVASLRPKAFLVENVKGLLRSTFADHFEYVILRLSHPLITIQRDQSWREHRGVLERVHTAGSDTGLDYHVVFQLLNAADYGVPQRRERVFIVGFRSDLGVQWSFPEPTHSQNALLRDQLLTEEYWERHGVPKRMRPPLSKSLINRAVNLNGFEDLQPWRTVRDAISDLPKLRIGETSPLVPNHFLNPGARSYKGHTGSPLDEPAKTLKAGDHGVPGGENTLALPDGAVRYFSVRERARLQSFPDDFRVCGAWTEQMRQMGNAVPVRLAEVVSGGIIRELRRQSLRAARAG